MKKEKAERHKTGVIMVNAIMVIIGCSSEDFKANIGVWRVGQGGERRNVFDKLLLSNDVLPE